jgi:hypothetical protein
MNSKRMEDLNARPETRRLLQENMGTLQDVGTDDCFSGYDLKCTGNRSKNRQMGLQSTKNLHSKGNRQQSEETVHRMEANICMRKHSTSAISE